MKVRCEIDLNVDTGEYEMKFWNMSHPGRTIEYNEVRSMVKKVFMDTDNQIESTGNDSDERVTKIVH